MKEDLVNKMEKLRKRLDYQEEKMLDQRDSVEDLMGNIITGALKQGNSNICRMDPNNIY